jgi:LemA protein
VVALLWGLGAAVVALLVAVPWFQYNRMVALRNRCKESWSNVDTELRRRHDLVPNLVAAVKGYAKHERDVVDSVVRARAAALAAGAHVTKLAAEEDRLVVALDRLLALAEAYPALRASENFLRLQEELAVTEDRIQAARRFYNANVRDYRNQTRQVPGVLFAGLFGMREIEFFELSSPSLRRAPAVALAGAH